MTNELPPPPNIRKLEDLTYIVRTQAGFRKACRYARQAWEETKQSCIIEGYPTSYPSVVELAWNRYGPSHVTCIPFHEYLVEHKRKLAILLNHDR
jgi:hypothetical protein